MSTKVAGMRHVGSPNPEVARMVAAAKANGITNGTGLPDTELRATMRALRKGSASRPRHAQEQQVLDALDALREDVARLDAGLADDLQAIFDGLLELLDRVPAQTTPTSARASAGRGVPDPRQTAQDFLESTPRERRESERARVERRAAEAEKLRRARSKPADPAGSRVPPPPSMSKFIRSKRAGLSNATAIAAARQSS